MLVLLHVGIALSSVIFTTVLFFKPSKANFLINYGLIATTFVTGTVLVVSTHAPLVPSCITGLVYLSVVTVGTVAAQQRLAKQK